METAYDEWISMYSESAGRLWMGERAEIRKAAMLIHILGLELLKVKTHAEAELEGYRKVYMQIDSTKPTLSATPSHANKSHTKVSDEFKKLTPILLTNKENSLKNSYVSPDLFNWDSLDSSGSLDRNVVEDDIVQSQKQLSPKIIRKSRKYFRSRNIGEKFNSQSQMAKRVLHSSYSNCTPRRSNDDVIDSTPEPDTKKAKNNTKSFMTKGRNRAKVLEKDKPKFVNTLTQMYEQIEKSNKSNNTINCDTSQQNLGKPEVFDPDGETIIVNFDSEKPDEEDVNTMLNGDDDVFKQFAMNYDQVPEKVPEVKEPVKYSCRTCSRLGYLCSKHDANNKPMQKTFSGFWDLDFTGKNSNEESERSTIFL